MSSTRLKSITIQDFRSIDGQVTVPLDAPIVLMHGVNGSGKTSVLTALELALTGSAEGISRGALRDLGHLVHRGRPQAEVALQSRIRGIETTSRLVIDREGLLDGGPALPNDEQRTFTERCYLSQLNVSRLLDIYQNKSGGESALTRFVNEILGLDKLEALIDGLFPAGNVTRLRPLVSGLNEVEARLRGLNSELNTARRREEEATRIRENTVRDLKEAWIRSDIDVSRIQAMGFVDLLALEAPSSTDEEGEGILEATRQDLVGLRARSLSIPPQEREEGTALETSARAASDALSDWNLRVGITLEQALGQLTLYLPETPDIALVGPARAVSAGRTGARVEIERLRRILAADAEARENLARDVEQLDKARERLNRLSNSATSQPGQLQDEARVLAELIPHLGDRNICPVCERDYAEVSSQPLADQLARRLAALNSEVNRLRQIFEVIKEIKGDEARLLQSIHESRASQLTQDERQRNQELLASMSELAVALDRLLDDSLYGDRLIQAEREARTGLLQYRNQATRTAEIRQELARLAGELGEPSPSDSEPLEGVIQRLLDHVQTRLAEDRAIAETHRRIALLREKLRDESARVDEARRALALTREKQVSNTSVFDAFKSRKKAATLLAAQAETELSRAVEEVFNHSLNKTWRELFVRLVPSEPFVPAFEVISEGRKNAIPRLTTHHRDGGVGGNPSYVLSAGNLNTAAVTLFLALHLSADPDLPWLILDDPVQSMDEVHISQFAALLRTLSKRNNKQVILAVHEKSLFDYLCLELSPAFQDDRLITVELSRPDGGSTQIEPAFLTWDGDQALDAG